MLLTIHHEDDLLAIIDRILTTPDRDIVLVIPDGARILGSEENFSLLKREAETVKKRIAIQSTDQRARHFAVQAGLPFLSAAMPISSAARRFSDITPPVSRSLISQVAVPQKPETPPVPSAVRAPLAPQPEPIPLLEDTLPQGMIEKRRFFSLPSFFRLPGGGRRKIEAALFVLGLVLVGLVAVEVLPNVEVRIVPRTEELSFSYPVTVSVEQGGAENIAGQRIRVEANEERNVPASGSSEVTQRASGTIVITNAFSSSSQSLVATTRFMSEGGKLFRLDKTIVVPGASIEDGKIIPSSIEATVSADEPGEEFNIGPSSFSIPGFQGTPKFTAFTAKSSAAMTGGARGKVKVITEDDVTKSIEGLAGIVREKLQERFTVQLPEDLVVLPDATIEIIAEETDVKAGAYADSVVGRAKGERSAIVFREEDIRAAASAFLKERIADGTAVLEKSLSLAYSVSQRDIDAGSLTLDVAVRARAAWTIDEEMVRSSLAGKREGEIRSWLAEQEAIENAKVRFSPFWVDTAPENPKRIKVRIDLDGGLAPEAQEKLDMLVGSLLRWAEGATRSL